MGSRTMGNRAEKVRWKNMKVNDFKNESGPEWGGTWGGGEAKEKEKKKQEHLVCPNL